MTRTPIERFNDCIISIEQIRAYQREILANEWPTMAPEVVEELMAGKLKLVDSFGLALVEPTGE